MATESTFTIGIVEDEAIIAEGIIMALESLGYKTTEPAINYTEALKMIEREKPDLVLLDIQLSGSKTGIDVAQKIKDEYDLPFIFLTANGDQMTIDAVKKLDPPAFLVKPFNKKELFASIEIALHNYAKADATLEPKVDTSLALNKFIFIKQKDRYFKVNYNDITYLKSDHVYVDIFTESKERFTIRSTMNDLMQRINSPVFFKVHRRYIVNIEKISYINGHEVMVANESIPITKEYRDTLLAAMNTI